MKKTIVITGCSSGIGRDMALYFAEKGFQVLAGVRKDKDAASLSAHAGITPAILDVVDEKSVMAAATHPLLKNSSEVHLVNNAGIALGGPIEATPLDRWKQQFDVNVFGLVTVTRAFLPFIRATKGRVVNISSVAGLAASPYLAPYAASKFAVEAISDSLRRELKQFGVKVIIVEPGPVKTPIWEKGISVQDASVLDEKLNALYEKEMQQFREYVKKSENDAVEVRKVSALILGAITATSPRIRYVVGARGLSLQMKLVRLLPDSWLDSMIAKEMGAAAKP